MKKFLGMFVTVFLLFVLLSCGEANRDTKLKNEMEDQGWTCTDTSCTILYAIYNYEYTFSTMTLTSSWTYEGESSGSISMNLATGELSENLTVIVSELLGGNVDYEYSGNIYTDEYECSSSEFENICMSEVFVETFLDLAYQYITGVIEAAGLTLDDFKLTE